MEYKTKARYIIPMMRDIEFQCTVVKEPLNDDTNYAYNLQQFILRNYKEIFDFKQTLSAKLGEKEDAAANNELLRYIEFFVSFSQKTSGIKISKTQIKELVKMRVDVVPSTEKDLINLYTDVLYKFFFKNNSQSSEKNIFRSEQVLLLFCIIVLRQCVHMNLDLSELKQEIFSNEEFWNEVKKCFFNVDSSQLKNVWKKLLRKYSEKQNWKKEEVQLLSEIVRYKALNNKRSMMFKDPFSIDDLKIKKYGKKSPPF